MLPPGDAGEGGPVHATGAPNSLRMFHRVIEKLVVGMAVMSGAGFVCLTLLVCTDVLNRNLHLLSMPWTVNAAEFLLYGMTFLGAPWVLLRGGHIVIDLLTQAVPPRWARALGRVSNGLGLFVNLVMLVYAVRALHSSFVEGTMVYKALVFPEWYVFVPAPFAFGCLALIFLSWLISPELQAAGEGQAGV